MVVQTIQRPSIPIALALLAGFDLIKFAPNSLSNILLTFVPFFVWVEI